MVLEQSFMLREVIGLNREIGPIHRFCAMLRAQKINQGLCFAFRGEPAKPLLRHAGRRVPERKIYRGALVDTEGPVPYLEAVRYNRCRFKRHRAQDRRFFACTPMIA